MLKSIQISADYLVSRLVSLEPGRRACVLDSCGVGHLGSHLMIAGIDPVKTAVLSGSVEGSLRVMDQLQTGELAALFTISYDFGRKLQKGQLFSVTTEPDVYIALFNSLIVHDYASGETYISGRFNGNECFEWLPDTSRAARVKIAPHAASAHSNFSQKAYLEAVETIKEHIRRGDTYQTNLTQTLTAHLSDEDEPGDVFMRLRREHPAPFAAFFDRGESHVISASPERFFKIHGNRISTSPIKGTRPRGRNEMEDERLRLELISSPKDRSENTMIVDLLRNDLGRVCEYGSVVVEKLCDVEQHPTLFHLVSTIEGNLRQDVHISDASAALFPCGSITGAPKIRTMEIIDELEPDPRGLSMGAIGYFIPESGFEGLTPGFDLSVAIRTITVRDRIAKFNVGGGVTIESDPDAEYAESLLKAKALLAALKAKLR